MTLDPIPPAPGLVTTRKAALLYGKSEHAVLKALRGEGVEPVVSEKHTGGKYYWWNPVDVLKVRAIKAERLADAQRRFALMAKAGHHHKDRRGARLKARETRLETERQKILARLKERQCATAN